MAKHRFQFSEITPATGLLVLAALLGGGALPQAAVGQQPAMGALQNARKMQETVAKKDSTPPQQRAVASPTHRAERRDKGPALPHLPVAAGKTHVADLGSGKRDPFKLPLAPAAGGRTSEGALGISGPLPAGNRGLIISQMKLEGVVREDTSNKMLAVVTNETKRAYFLTENDTVYNGVVSKITPDAVYFKENVLDQNGRVTTREVVKRLGSAPGEGR